MKQVLNKQYSISKPLVEYLKGLFPNQLPNNRDLTINDVSFLQGQQSVLAKLEEMYDQEFEE
tara:strand:+ start:2485 stop:2670 length:186 start_codon:yes stop_codon:yes gene_type:complete